MKRIALVIIGHGGVPRDYPRERLRRMKTLAAARRATGEPVSPEEARLENELRHWPRNAETDPYGAGLEAIVKRVREQLPIIPVVAAYNEFCTPDLTGAVACLAEEGAQDIRVVTVMVTPGGGHSEKDIPEAIEALAGRFPGVEIRYAWPFDLDRVADLLVCQAGLKDPCREDRE